MLSWSSFFSFSSFFYPIAISAHWSFFDCLNLVSFFKREANILRFYDDDDKEILYMRNSNDTIRFFVVDFSLLLFCYLVEKFWFSQSILFTFNFTFYYHYHYWILLLNSTTLNSGCMVCDTHTHTMKWAKKKRTKHEPTIPTKNILFFRTFFYTSITFFFFGDWHGIQNSLDSLSLILVAISQPKPTQQNKNIFHIYSVLFSFYFYLFISFFVVVVVIIIIISEFVHFISFIWFHNHRSVHTHTHNDTMIILFFL